MISNYKERTGVDKLCKWAEIAKSSMYYQVHPGPRGIKPSTHTMVGNIALVENDLVWITVFMVIVK